MACCWRGAASTGAEAATALAAGLLLAPSTFAVAAWVAALVGRSVAFAGHLAAGGISSCRHFAVLEVALAGFERPLASVGRKVEKVLMASGNSFELQPHRQVQLRVPWLQPSLLSAQLPAAS